MLTFRAACQQTSSLAHLFWVVRPDVDGAFGTNLGFDVCAPTEFGAWVTQLGNQYSQLRDQCSKRRASHILISKELGYF